ncbi:MULTISPECIES: DUF1795 domain-containing protein [Paraburkholderia]|jgi:hypothetical protein|uniref:DUF1795 domain-containing protein n=1 Tax=Paraburkholderia TaxID=1822464 RepID=UPI00190D986D|nr:MULTISPECIES: DcrB-related protein [Paraburkholderia]MCP2091421.1 hypothetical protein [Paraburkholderia sediminicola]MBK3840604.1 DcrB-related protein [Paraburkholderia aspalathi]MCX4142456.1 DcrB-related protein [Paraburkholderia aspalathi]MDN7175136.1 DcrB-related protein [Paraburkholderia sp. SEWSISQ10-3 4]MDQ6504777.1 DcrB-related protein [Paraburkholderia aspalathi]
MYQIQEGSLSLPADWHDKTMNVFVSAATGTEGVSFVVTRESLPWGMKFHEYTANEIQKLSKQVAGYELVAGAESEVSGRAAYTHEFRWLNNGKPIQQLLTMVEYGKRVLMLTFTAPGTISETQKTQVHAMIQSFSLNEPN